MDHKLETQVDRVLGAFRKAANKHWGSEEPMNAPIPRSAHGKFSRLPKEEDPKRNAVRSYLLENPNASNVEVMISTRASKHIVTELRAALNIPAKLNRYETRMQKQAREWFERNPGSSAVEASKGTGLNYATCKRARVRFEKAMRIANATPHDGRKQ